MGWRNVGKKIISGSTKAAKGAGEGVTKFQKFQVEQQKRAGDRKQQELRKLDMDIKLARKKATLRKLKPSDPWDIDI